MPSTPCLLRRGRWYYFRVRVPVDLVPYFERRYIAVSLHTSDYRLAASRARRTGLRASRGFGQMRELEMDFATYERIRGYAKDLLKSFLQAIEMNRGMAGFGEARPQLMEWTEE